MAAPDFETVQANGLDFAVLSLGDGPLVLLLHGFPDRPHSWLPIMEGLAAAGYRAVAPAMRGYHPTEIPSDGDYRIPTLGRDALALIEALGAEQAVVIGHDWGASAAYAATNLGPDRVRALCTLAIPHPRIIKPSLGLLLRARHFLLFQFGGLGRWWARRKNMAYIEYLYRYWSPTWPDPEAHIEAVKADFSQPGRLDAALAYYAQLSDANKRNADNKAIRGRTAQPSLLFVGKDDGALRFETDFDGIEDCFTGPMQLVQVEGAGHFVPAEKPREVLDALIPFLDGLP
jgi:pimeloyl-ACP methyl ester carboxylesterase